MEHRPQAEPVLADDRRLWFAIPRKVAYAYIPKKYHAEMKALEKAGKSVNPLWYSKDRPLIHKLRIWHIQRKQFGWYETYAKKPIE